MVPLRTVGIHIRIAVLVSWLLPAATFAQTPEETEDEAVSSSVNYVFATDLGSGIYDLDGRSLQIYRYTYDRPLAEGQGGAPDFNFVLPITAGFFDFNPIDVLDEGPPTRVDSFSVVPGVELDFKLDDDDMRRIETLDSPGGRIGPDPATATF